MSYHDLPFDRRSSAGEMTRSHIKHLDRISRVLENLKAARDEVEMSKDDSLPLPDPELDIGV